MAKKQLSLTVDADLVDLIDQIAKDKKQNRSECIEEMLSKAMGDDGSGLIEFYKVRAHPAQLMDWMHTTNVFNDLESVPDGEDGMAELVLRVTRRRLKLSRAKRGKK